MHGRDPSPSFVHVVLPVLSLYFFSLGSDSTFSLGGFSTFSLSLSYPKKGRPFPSFVGDGFTPI